MRAACFVGLLGLMTVACGEDGPGTTSPPRSSPPTEAATTSPPESTVAAPGGGVDCDFAPANGLPCEDGLVDADLSASCDAAEIDTTSGKFACGVNAPSRLIDQGPGRPKIRAFFVRALSTARGVIVRVTGDNALAIVSRGDVVLEGVLDASADNRDCTAGPGGYAGGPGEEAKGKDGFGPGGGIGNGGYGGAGGGSYGGIGGGGGNDANGSAVGAAAGPAYGDATLVPFMGGSGGGGDSFCGGGGGGAVHVVSSTSIMVAAGGGINVGGGSSLGYHGGGGSGGAILLEAPKVDVAGTLAANGGGGGYGCGGDFSAAPACGGTYGGGVGSSGLDGAGAPGASSDWGGAGGGGGAGRIRVQARERTITGVVSPSIASGLASTGPLGAK